ncbi:MAG: murein hydrolase activator EnvC family protein [Gammaproteobacteria bacterium]
MRRPQWIVRWVVLVLCSFTSIADANETVQKQQQLTQLRQQINELRTSLMSSRTQKDRLQLQLRATEMEIGRLNLSLRKIGEKIIAQQTELDRLNRTKQRQQQDLRVHQLRLSQQIVASYAMGRQGYLKLLLNQRDPVEVGRVLTYYDIFNKTRASRIESISDKILEINHTENKITEEKSKLESFQHEHQQRIAGLQKKRGDRKQILIRVDEEIQTKEQRLDKLLDDEKRLSHLIESIREAMIDIPVEIDELEPFSKLRGKLQWPTLGRITSKFGASRKLGNVKWHGVLIDADEGKDVKSIYHGRVVFADWLRGFGLLIIIDHGDGYMSLYGHNQSLFKSVGEWVQAGEAIASIGDSGGQDMTGLYFEIRHNGKPKNPLKWCKS